MGSHDPSRSEVHYAPTKIVEIERAECVSAFGKDIPRTTGYVLVGSAWGCVPDRNRLIPVRYHYPYLPQLAEGAVLETE